MTAPPKPRAGRPERLGGRVVSGTEGLLTSWGGGQGGSSPRLQVAEIQRTRLLAAAVGVVEEYGYADATISRVTARARISRRTFYELFDNREDCLVAVLESALERITAEIAGTNIHGASWRERVRTGLWIVLSFFDREPALARVCVVQSLRGSERVLARRADVLARLVAIIDQGRAETSRAGDIPPLTAEGLVGAAHSIVYDRLLKRDSEPLTGLLGDLMGMIVLPYLGAAAARREQTRSLPAQENTTIAPRAADGPSAERDPLESLPMRLTYRTACVLQAIAEHPGISNRMAGDQAGVSDQGQISKLLARLERLGLIANAGERHVKGEANAWRLTPTGTQVAHRISNHTVPDDRRAA